MKPYYQDELVTLYHGECRDVAEQVIPAAVGLLLTDPPYGMAFVSGWTAAKATVRSDGVRQGVRVVRSALNTFSDLEQGRRRHGRPAPRVRQGLRDHPVRRPQPRAAALTADDRRWLTDTAGARTACDRRTPTGRCLLPLNHHGDHHADDTRSTPCA